MIGQRHGRLFVRLCGAVRPAFARRGAACGRVLVLALLIAASLATATALARPHRVVAANAVSVRIANYTYDPAVLTIIPGTTVRWTNYQTDTNDVVVRDGPVIFRSPSLRPGDSFEYTFTQLGTYVYFCAPHPFMTAEVRVVPDERVVFPATGFAVEGTFLRYWRGHGLDLGDPGISERESLALFGYPIGAARPERLGEREYLVQYFERARLEYHPEQRQPYDVLLGQFGRQLHPPDPAAAPLPGAAYFAETGHNLAGRFGAFWAANGGLAVFGFPLSEEISERLGDGQLYRVQYFERARLEYHPENAAPYDVLLGQFGRVVLGDR